MLKLSEAPKQVVPLAVNTGVTFTVATMGKELVLVGMNEEILPVPVAASPMDTLVFAQLYVVPVPEKLIDPEPNSLQRFKSFTGFTVGFPKTVMVWLSLAPIQPFKEGVTVIVITTFWFPDMLIRAGRISPVPEAAKPIPG